MDKAMPAQIEEDVIDLREILGKLIDYRWLIAVTTATFIIFAVLFCIIRTPAYQASLLLNSNVNSNSNALNGIMGETISLFSRNGVKTETETSILKSRSVLEPVIQKLQLDIIAKPKSFPLLGHYFQRKFNATNTAQKLAPATLGLTKYGWGGSEIKVAKLMVPNALKGHPMTLIAQVGQRYTLLRGTTKLGTGTIGQLEQFKTSPHGFIQLKIDQLKANVGTHFTIEQMRMGDAINALSNKLKISPVGKETSLLTLNFSGSNPYQIAKVLNAIADSAVLFDIKSQSHEAGKTLSFLQSRLPSVKAALTAAEKRLNAYRAKSGNIELTAETKLMLSKMSQVQTQIENVSLELAQLKQQYTNKSFQVKQAETTLSKLNQQKVKLGLALKALPQADQMQVGMLREVKIQNAIYLTLQNKIQQFEIMKAGTIGKVSVIDEAAIPYAPTNKPASIIIALSGFLGLFFSIAFVFARQFLFPHIEDPEIIETKLQLAHLGSLQESKLQAEQLKKYEKKKISHLKFLSEISSHDLSVESFRSMRTNILFEAPEAKNNIIAICGPTPNVGKSFTSANLAQVLADADHKVLLIDCDIRKGDLYQYFTAPKTPGFCELASGKNKLDDVLHQSRIENLDFIPTGTIHDKHSELLMKPSIKEWLEKLSAQYDFVIIDTAPILAVTDALQLFKHAGMHLLTFAYGKHSIKELEHTVKRFEKSGISLNGFIFNRMNPGHANYGKKYQYGYTYGKPTK